MSLAKILTSLLTSEQPIFYIENLIFYLLPILEVLKKYQSDILVIVRNDAQTRALDLGKTSANIDIVTEEKFKGGSYDYLFFLGECKLEWSKFALHTILEKGEKYITPFTVTIPLSAISPLPSIITYSKTNYTLDNLFFVMAQDTARLARIDPSARILLLLPSFTEVESVVNLLKGARLSLPTLYLEEIEKFTGSGIIVGVRSAALLLAYKLLPTHTFDSCVEGKWNLTWTHGRREKLTLVSKEEAEKARILGGVIQRMMRRDFYPNLEEKYTPTICRWRRQFTSPLINKCCPEIIQGSPEFQEFVLSHRLGVRPALLLWKWYQDGKSPYPMVVLASLLDSYGPYFEYPPQGDLSDDDYNLILRQHQEKYFLPFLGNNDLITLLHIWQEFPGIDELETWTNKNSLRKDKLSEVYSLITEFRSYFGIEEEKIPPTFLEEATSYIRNVYQDRIMEKKEAFFVRGNINYIPVGVDYRLSTSNPEKIYALVVSEEKYQGIYRCLLWVTFPY